MAYDNEGKYDGSGPKMVLESDLIAVKEGAKRDKETWETEKTTLGTEAEATSTRHKGELNTANTLAATRQEEASTLRTELSGLTSVSTDLESSKIRVTELTSEAETAANSLTAANTRLLELRKANIIASGGDEEKVKAITTNEELEGIEKALDIIGTDQNGKRPGFFGGKGGGGDSSKQTSGSKILAGIKAGEYNRTT